MVENMVLGVKKTQDKVWAGDLGPMFQFSELNLFICEMG